MIQLSATPPERCLQFLNELGESAKDMQIITPEGRYTISELLPNAPGPQNQGFKGGLLTHSMKSPKICARVDHACNAADDSYTLYSKVRSGLAIFLKDGSIYKGSYLENAARKYLSPLQTALVALHADGKKYEEIDDVTLAKYGSVNETDKRIYKEIKTITIDFFNTAAPQAYIGFISTNYKP